MNFLNLLDALYICRLTDEYTATYIRRIYSDYVHRFHVPFSVLVSDKYSSDIFLGTKKYKKNREMYHIFL
jgi:hypothetical protein